MTLIVADSSSLNVLIKVGCIAPLGDLFSTVLLPQAVIDELISERSPVEVREFGLDPPDWALIRNPRRLRVISRIDPGELAAISLASEFGCQILVDDLPARTAATAMGLPVIGSVGILERAADDGLIDDLIEVHERIRQGNFYIAEKLLAESLARHRSRTDA